MGQGPEGLCLPGPLTNVRSPRSQRVPPWVGQSRTLSADQIVERIRGAIRPNTRVVGITWEAFPGAGA
jgi:hypothetical protein